MKLKVGDSAPDFVLPASTQGGPDQHDKLVSLSDYVDKWILLYFYPKDDTGGCTKEALCMLANLPDFSKLDCVVLGVSVDSVESHKKFAAKYKLTFTLISDENKELVQAYGVWGKKKFMGREYTGTRRTSFLIDPKGKIAKIYENVKPETHADEVLADLASLKTRS